MSIHIGTKTYIEDYLNIKDRSEADLVDKKYADSDDGPIHNAILCGTVIDYIKDILFPI